MFNDQTTVMGMDQCYMSLMGSGLGWTICYVFHVVFVKIIIQAFACVTKSNKSGCFTVQKGTPISS